LLKPSETGTPCASTLRYVKARVSGPSPDDPVTATGGGLNGGGAPPTVTTKLELSMLVASIARSNTITASVVVL
jgi:hypothetical protein